MKKNLLWWISGAVFLFFLVKGFFGHTKHEPPVPRPVQTAKAEQKDVPIYIESFGTLASPNNVNISPQVSGKVNEVYFKEGDRVKTGDMLFLIDPNPYKAELEKAKAQLTQDEADLKLKKDTLERNRKLITTNLISEQDFEKYNTDVSAAEARIKLDHAAIDIAQINLDYCYIKSPIEGITGKRLVDPGNVVSANSNTTLVNIKTIDMLYIDFTVPEKNLPAIREAMSSGELSVEIIVTGDDKKKYTGSLRFMDNAVDNSTGTISLRAVIDNSRHELWSGQFVRVSLILGTEKGATLVPYEAIELGQKGPYSFVVLPDQKVEMRAVNTGNRQGKDIVVKNGIKPGETVVTEGQLGLSPGAAVVDITNQAKVKVEDKVKGGS